MKRVAILVCVVAVLGLAGKGWGQEARVAKTQKVTVTLNKASAEEALSRVLTVMGQRGESYVLKADLSELPPVSMTLSYVEADKALMLVCDAAGLQAERRDGVWVITKRPGVLNIGGVEVPVLGAVGIGGGRGGGGGGGMATPRPPAPGFPGDYVLVDLEVKEAPLSEVAGQLERAVARGLEGTNSKGIEIVVHDSAKDIKVTARAFKWPAGELLNMLLDQAGMTYTVEGLEETGAARNPPDAPRKVYLVPRPEVSVAGGRASLEWLGPMLSQLGVDLQKEGVTDTTGIYIGGLEGLKALENLKVLGPERCPKCNEVVLLPGCNYCPKCGAKLPEKSKPEATPAPTPAPKPEAQKKG